MPVAPECVVTDDREDAWAAVHEALPSRWHVGPPIYDRGRHAWSVTARGPHPGRGKAPVTVAGSGDNEVAALRDLDSRLRGARKPDGSRLDELRRRLRLAYVGGAESWAEAELGRSLTIAELGRVLRRFPDGSLGQQD